MDMKALPTTSSTMMSPPAPACYDNDSQHQHNDDGTPHPDNEWWQPHPLPAWQWPAPAPPRWLQQQQQAEPIILVLYHQQLDKKSGLLTKNLPFWEPLRILNFWKKIWNLKMKSDVLNISKSSDLRKLSDNSEISDHHNLSQICRKPEPQRIRYFWTFRLPESFSDMQKVRKSENQIFQTTRISFRYAESQNYRNSDIPDTYLRYSRLSEFLSDMQKVRSTENQIFQTTRISLRYAESQTGRSSDILTIPRSPETQPCRLSYFSDWHIDRIADHHVFLEFPDYQKLRLADYHMFQTVR